jgi:T5SS/PEP-CTERM-associated repeat protein
MKRVAKPSPRNHARFWLPAIAFLGAGRALADDVGWGNINGGTFSVGGNWIGGVVPDATSRAIFSRWRPGNEQPAYTVSFSTDPTNQAMVVGGDSVTFDLNGHAYLLTDPGSAISVGTATGSSGRLTIIDGVVATTGADPVARIGTNGVQGFLTISTGGQLLGPQIIVGDTGPGTLSIQSGGDLVGRVMNIGGFNGGSGTATVAGAGSGAVAENLIVGAIASGTLNINGGGRVECTFATLAHQGTSFGTVNVDGVNSRLICSNTLEVGGEGQGVMVISGGGRVECLAGTVGLFPTSTSTATVGGNSQWIMANGLIVGFEGRGTLNISGGSLVQSTSGLLGDTAEGAVNIEGAGTRWLNSDFLNIGAAGDGTLNITGGALVTCADGIIATEISTSNGLVTVSGAGSQWTIADSLSVGGDIEQGTNGGSGTLEIGQGGTVSVGTVFIFPQGVVALQGGTLDAAIISRTFGPGGQLLIQSGILHVDVFGFSLLNQGGTLAPGHSAGSTAIFGNYTQQAAGTMEVEIGGTASGTQFDRVTVNGTAALGGTLDLRLINGFAPSPDQTFVVLEAISITGAFANAASGQRLPTADGAGSFAVHYGDGSPFDPTQVVLSDFGVCIADFNGDGVVDTRDVLAFLNAWAYRDPSADCDANRVIDTRDVLCFLNAWSAGC